MGFQHVHLDLVGPLPVSEGSKYHMTMIEGTTHWPEAVPITDIKADIVARAFTDGWVSQIRRAFPNDHGQGNSVQLNPL